jgi:hypothetical protein
VVDQLLAQHRPVRALVRDPAKAAVVLPDPAALAPGLFTLCAGDLGDEASVVAAVAGCGAVVAVSGTARLSKPGDFWPWRLFGHDPMASGWCRDTRTHPYYVNYVGIKRLAVAADAAGATKFVRLTGLSVGFPVWDPVTVLFNLLLSLSVGVLSL